MLVFGAACDGKIDACSKGRRATEQSRYWTTQLFSVGIVAWHRKRTGCAPAKPAKAYTYGDGAHPLVGYKFSLAEIEQAIRTATPRKAQPAPPPIPALKTFSWIEVRPEGAWSSALQRPAHWCDGFARYLADALGFAEPPRLRWFTDVTEGAKQGPGWHQALFPASTGVPRGGYDPTTGDVWVEYHLSERDAKFTLAHELRHAWQCRTYGPSYINEHRAAAEADADAFASQYA